MSGLPVCPRMRVSTPQLRAYWTVAAGGKFFRVRTCSARTALEHGHKRTNDPAVLLGLAFEEQVRRIHVRGPTRFQRRRQHLLPEAIRRRELGETISEIARALHVPRETLRDWFRQVAA